MPSTRGSLTAALIALIGEAQTLVLYQSFCYQRLSVPNAPLPPDHPLVQSLGAMDAQAVLEQFGGRCLLIPSGRDLQRAERDRAILAGRQAGVTVGALAKNFDLSRRRIYQIVASGRDDKMRQNRC